MRFKAIKQQLIYCSDDYIVTDSQNYITAEFEFSEEWTGVTKTAIFKGTNGTYSVLLTGNACVIPYEVLTSGFSVSVYGVSGNMRITSDSVYINAVKSGYEDGETPSDPTPTVYEEILDKFSDIKQADSERAEQVKKNVDDINSIQSDIGNVYDNMEALERDITLKVDKVQGKGLSENDYTDEEKEKLSHIEENANNYVLPSDVVHDNEYVHTDNNYTDGEKEQVKNISSNISNAVNDVNSNIQNKLLGKVDKVSGKGLSSNDYTDEEKEKLSGIETNANNYVLPSDVVHDVSYVHTDNNYTASEKNKLAELNNYDDTDIKADIAKKADKLKSIPHTKLSGNPITITDALADEQPLEMRVYGDGIGDLNNGKYEIPIKITGKNMFDISKITKFVSAADYTTVRKNYASVRADGTITNTIGRAADSMVYHDSKMTLAQGTYTLSADCRFVSDSSGLLQARIGVRDMTNSKWLEKTATLKALNATERIYYTFTVDSDTEIAINIQGVGTIKNYIMNLKISNIQLEQGDTATEYEPYSEHTATAILDTPLSGSEYIDFVSKKRNSKTDITVNGNITLFDGANNITCQTEISPSKLEVSYYQDINKVLEKLKNAILSQGGNV